MKYILVFRKNDFSKASEKLLSHSFLALNPDAFFYAKNKGIKVVSLHTIFQRREHLSCVWHRRKLFKNLLNHDAYNQNILTSAEKLVLLRMLLRWHSDIWKLKKIITKTKAEYILIDGEQIPIKVDGRLNLDALCHIIGGEIKPQKEDKTHKLKFASPSFFFLFRFIRKLTILALRATNKKIFCTSSLKDTTGFVANFYEKNSKFLNVSVVNISDSCSVFLFLFKSIVSGFLLRKKHILIPLCHRSPTRSEQSRVTDSITHIIETIYDADLKSYCLVQKENLLNPLLSTTVLTDDSKEIINVLQPNFCASYDSNQVSVAAFHNAAMELSVKSIAVNHNPFNLRENKTKSMMEQLIYLRANPDLFDEVAVISKDTYDHLKKLPAYKKINLIPVNPVTETQSKDLNSVEKPLILHAGSISNWGCTCPKVWTEVYEKNFFVWLFHVWLAKHERLANSAGGIFPIAE